MTIAKWVGHKDGGILVGKVYGHLSDEHARKQAMKLMFSVNQGNLRGGVRGGSALRRVIIIGASSQLSRSC